MIFEFVKRFLANQTNLHVCIQDEKKQNVSYICQIAALFTLKLKIVCLHFLGWSLSLLISHLLLFIINIIIFFFIVVDLFNINISWRAIHSHIEKLDTHNFFKDKNVL